MTKTDACLKDEVEKTYYLQLSPFMIILFIEKAIP